MTPFNETLIISKWMIYRDEHKNNPYVKNNFYNYLVKNYPHLLVFTPRPNVKKVIWAIISKYP